MGTETSGIPDFNTARIEHGSGSGLGKSIRHQSVEVSAVAAGERGEKKYSWKYDIDMQSGSIFGIVTDTVPETDDVQVGDLIDIYVDSGTIGTLTADAASDANVLTVSSTVLAYAKKGHFITLADNTTDVYEIKDIDEANSQITVEMEDSTDGLQAAFSDTDAVKLRIYFVGTPLHPLKLAPGSHRYEFGNSTFDSSKIPAGVELVMGFHNSGSAARSVYGQLVLLH